MSAVILSDRRVQLPDGDLAFSEEEIVEAVSQFFEGEPEERAEIEEIVASLFDALEEKNREDGEILAPAGEGYICPDCVEDIERAVIAERDLLLLAEYLKVDEDPVGVVIQRIKSQREDLEDELALSKDLLDEIHRLDMFLIENETKVWPRGYSPVTLAIQLITSLKKEKDGLLLVNKVLSEDLNTALASSHRPAYPASFTLPNGIPTQHPAVNSTCGKLTERGLEAA